MNRTHFLTLAATIALAVGAGALLAPTEFLATKGVHTNPAAAVWMREVGVALLAFGVMALRLRRAPDSPALRAFMLGNAVLQLGLLPIELLAYRAGVITEFWGVAPNSALHAVLAAAFAYFAFTRKAS
ncbi:hypothetical protein [Roseateles sp.]|uniref:hypothetical protein n=1 Tax=Roseateles sp. TaxID=1971397 RepID=UPI00394455B5